MRFLRVPGILRFAAFWAVAILLQWHSGAYQADAVGDPDEAAHVVSGVMLRQYLADGLGRPPEAFALDYYQHYPKVAIGHWPPVFYAEQALWTSLFPSTLASLLVMLALEAALVAALFWNVMRTHFGAWAAWLGSLVLITLPGIARGSGMVMSEIPMALLILLAVLQWGRYLDSGRTRHAVAFGLWSAAAILTKGTGLVLAAVPLLSILLTRRLDLMRRASFWAPALIVIVCAGPWYLRAPGALHERVVAYGGVGLVPGRISSPLNGWTSELGPVIVPLVLVGLAILLYVYLRASKVTLKANGVMASATALTLAAFLFPFLVAAWETRHITESSPAILLVACSALGWLASLPIVRRLTASYGVVVLTVASLATMLWNLQFLPVQRSLGYRTLAHSLTAGSLGPAQAVVIVGDANTEGAVIAEVALQQPEPSRYLLRGTKLFANVEWMGRVRDLQVHSAADVDALVTALPIDLILIDREVRKPYAYQPMVEEAIAGHPEKWARVEDPSEGSRFGAFKRRDSQPLTLSEVGQKLQSGLANPLSPQ